MDITAHRVELPGIELHVEVAGPDHAPPLLLLHGWPESARGWRKLIPHLADDFRLIMPDQRGFGRSGRPEGTDQYRVLAAAGDALGIIEWAAGEPLAVVGHDWGGAVAWAIGAVAPERVTRMVVMCAPHPMRLRQAAIANPDQLRRSFYAWLLDLGEPGERLLAAGGYRPLARWAFGESVGAEDQAAYIEEWSQPGAFHAMAEWYRANYQPALFNPEVPLDLPPVRVPVRYVHGGRDPAFVPEAATGSGEFVQAEFDEVLLPDASHWVVHEQPGTIAELIRDWLR